MPEKRDLPLNNPLSEKAVAVAPDTKLKTTGDNGGIGREKGVSKGGRERVRPAEAILKCQMCGHHQKMVFTFGKPPNYHRCIWCGELQPTDGYRVTMYGLDLPRVLAPHEVEARRRELAARTGVLI